MLRAAGIIRPGPQSCSVSAGGVQPQRAVRTVIHSSEGLEDQEGGSDVQVGGAPLFFGCATTVSELHPFRSLGLLFERKQIPQIVVNVRTLRKTTEPLEATLLPYKQEVRGSSPRAPTIQVSFRWDS
jgi:hypothetical protein